nr:MAG TPA: hypothetical protein [Caudoviricetes sp.]
MAAVVKPLFIGKIAKKQQRKGERSSEKMGC